MSRSARETVRALLAQAVSDLARSGTIPSAPSTIPIERPKRPEHGDYATNVALALAKPAGKAPRAVADAIVARLTVGGDAPLAEASIAGPGVINVRLRDRFWQRLQATFGDRIVLNGHPDYRLPNTLNVSFVGQSGADVLGRLDGVAASTGSACHTGSIELSPVLTAMATPPDVGMGAIRFSLGRGTTREEVDTVTDQLICLLAA